MLRVLAVVLTLLISLSLVACGTTETVTTTAKPSTAPPVTVTTTAEPSTAPPVTVTATASPMDEAKEFYKGKTIELVVDAPAGSGPDRAARALQPYLEQVTGATVVVENVEAAGGMVAHTNVWNAKPDGLTIGLSTTDSLLLFDLLNDPGAEYQVDKFGYLGCIAKEPSVFWVQADGPYDVPIAELQAMDEIKIAGHQPSSGITLGILTAAYLMDLNVSIATGFSSREAPMAVFQGDSAGFVSTPGSYLRYVEQGAKAVCLLDVTSTEALPDVPLISDIVQLSQDQQKLLDVKSMLHSGRILFTTPGIPAERLAFLQQCYEQVTQISEFRVDVGKVTGYDPPLPLAEETMSLVESLKSEEAYIQQIVKTMQDLYIK